MKDSFLYNKSLSFGVRCVNFYQFLKKKDVYVLSKQLLRSGTSIGANVRESRFAHSPADFISKLKIALKEGDECAYWLELFHDSGFLNDQEFNSIYKDNKLVNATLVRIINSTTR